MLIAESRSSPPPLPLYPILRAQHGMCYSVASWMLLCGVIATDKAGQTPEVRLQWLSTACTRLPASHIMLTIWFIVVVVFQNNDALYGLIGIPFFAAAIGIII